MTLPLEVHQDAEAAARRVAGLVADRVRGSSGPFSLALSKTPSALLDSLAAGGVPWERIDVYQVDERVAPRGSAERNLTALGRSLPSERLHPMPVDDGALEAAAERYARLLPESLDLVHLGLGPDGHTASLVPGDAVLDVRDRPVAVTRKYQGLQRMTLTYPPLDAAREIVWLVTGGEKRDALRRLLERDRGIPAARISNPAQFVVADAAAAGSQA